MLKNKKHQKQPLVSKRVGLRKDTKNLGIWIKKFGKCEKCVEMCEMCGNVMGWEKKRVPPVKMKPVVSTTRQFEFSGTVGT